MASLPLPALAGVETVMALVFALAGTMKLLDVAGAERSAREFGLPPAAAWLFSRTLAPAELCVAVALLSPLAWWGALAAAALLVAFMVGIALNLLLGKRPRCHCFGRLSSDRISAGSLIRIAVLLGAAALVLAAGPGGAGPGVAGWIWELGTEARAAALGAASGALLVGAGILATPLFRSSGLLSALLVRVAGRDAEGSERGRRRGEMRGLPAGTHVPALELPAVDGSTLRFDALRGAGRPVVLAFLDPECEQCVAMLPEVAEWQRQYARHFTLVIVSRGTHEENLHETAEHGLVNVTVQRDREVAEAFQAGITPSAVVVAPDGTVTVPLVAGEEAMRAVVRQLVAATDPTAATDSPSASAAATPSGDGRPAEQRIPPRTARGEPVPHLDLRDSRGRMVDISRLGPAVVLFWEPDGIFSHRVLQALANARQSAPQNGPRLLLVSCGRGAGTSGPSFRGMELTDPAFITPLCFGIDGTPAAVLIDAQGRVGSHVAVGVECAVDAASCAALASGSGS